MNTDKSTPNRDYHMPTDHDEPDLERDYPFKTWKPGKRNGWKDLGDDCYRKDIGPAE